MAATTPTKTWRATVDRWIAFARNMRDPAALRRQADWFDHIRPRLTALSEAERADLAAQLRDALSDLGA